MTATVRIAQLYPATLGFTGDRGNVRALRVRLEHAGATVEFFPVAIGDELPDGLDIIIIGNGPLSAIRSVHTDLLARGDSIRAFAASGGALLAIGAGAELLSRGITTLDGELIEGLGVFDLDVVRTRDRKVGYIVVDTSVGTVLGFEDHASEWTFSDPTLGFGRVVSGRGSFAVSATAGETARGELVRAGNAFASNVQGPLLPLNPNLVREILTAVLARRELVLDLDRNVESLDSHAAGARATIEALVHGKGFNTIQL
ncbi:Putative amidotransferase similar to cobyric acid synthase [Microbacterium esteraromaticum]|uniref:Lipid II isoglutaminyl synthase (glutamine-hydrolyzing) subunit GatD n=1 Tax=Microbacterium esteraromaticum TaxID=57043 RepID=A0A1R4IUH8_9MICO|nr:hypothetical protein [Microbacterium esteraromaticum]SJN23531.1 Putative amidotransferase similar to cobyric acid synthase [Microbacterium esteraromaticum]